MTTRCFRAPAAIVPGAAIPFLLFLLFSGTLLGQPRQRLEADAPPRYGVVSLAEDFASDPYVVDVVSNGVTDVSMLELCSSCTGFASPEPDLVLHWTGSSRDLRIFFEAAETGEDATLIVRAPDGTWIGNDDAYHGTRNPFVLLTEYGPGRYAIWVASYGYGDVIRGRLSVTEQNRKPVGEGGTVLELDVPYVPTTHEVVDAMLEVAEVGPGDYVIDLGSGDGRIVIAAARRGAYGHGIDLNPVRVKEAEENALEANVSDRVIFVEGDLFDADISRATVVTMYLLSSVNLRLKPVLLETLRPGTRVVSHAFSMGDWQPDQHLVADGRNVYFWIIPAAAGGNWTWQSGEQTFTMRITQTYQKIGVSVTTPAGVLTVKKPLLTGDRISFTAIDPNNPNRRYLFSGRVDGEMITGVVQIRDGDQRSIATWNATLTGR
jgi:SAM-dependent methyltransferase